MLLIFETLQFTVCTISVSILNRIRCRVKFDSDWHGEPSSGVTDSFEWRTAEIGPRDSCSESSRSCRCWRPSWCPWTAAPPPCTRWRTSAAPPSTRDGGEMPWLPHLQLQIVVCSYPSSYNWVFLPCIRFQELVSCPNVWGSVDCSKAFYCKEEKPHIYKHTLYTIYIYMIWG